MEQTIINMIAEAEEKQDYELIKHVKELINQFASTINCPSNWREIGTTLAETYEPDSWVYEELELWNYVD